MLDRVTDGVAVLDSDWRFGYVNLPAAAMLRRPRDELPGRTIQSQFPDAAAGEPFLRAFEEAMRHRRPATYTGYYPPLGRWFESRCFPRDDTLLVMFRDITELGTHYVQGFHLGHPAPVHQTSRPTAAAQAH
jgi:PAS domain-containing protein